MNELFRPLELIGKKAGTSSPGDLEPGLLAKRLFEALADVTAIALEVDPASVDHAEGDLVARAHTRLPHGRACPGLSIDALSLLYASIASTSRVQITALVFLYANGIKIAPSGLDYLWYSIDPYCPSEQWEAQGWAADEYGEYGEFALFDR